MTAPNITPIKTSAMASNPMAQYGTIPHIFFIARFCQVFIDFFSLSSGGVECISRWLPSEVKLRVESRGESKSDEVEQNSGSLVAKPRPPAPWIGETTGEGTFVDGGVKLEAGNGSGVTELGVLALCSASAGFGAKVFTGYLEYGGSSSAWVRVATEKELDPLVVVSTVC